jgi:hypothetical protein
VPETADKRRAWLWDTTVGRLISAYAYYPCVYAGWHGPALKAARNLASRLPFDAVLSTSPPRVTHLIARDVARELGIPWVMDLRDPWQTGAGGGPLDARLVAARHERLFARYAREASAIVANTDRYRLKLAAEHPDLAARIVAIPNGCVPRAPSPAADAVSQFRMGHYGELYDRRTAAGFLRGLRLWLDSNAVDRSHVLVSLVGQQVDAKTSDAICSLDLSECVRIHPRLPVTEVGARMAREYVLLLLANDWQFQIPAKTYEYLAAGRRIVAWAERESATADLLRGVSGCAVVDTPEEAAAALDGFYREWLSGAEAQVDYGRLQAECSYANRAAEMASLLIRTVERRGADPTRR